MVEGTYGANYFRKLRSSFLRSAVNRSGRLASKILIGGIAKRISFMQRNSVTR